MTTVGTRGVMNVVKSMFLLMPLSISPGAFSAEKDVVVVNSPSRPVPVAVQGSTNVNGIVNVLPPQAEPSGYSLADAAEATAVFNVTGHSGTPPNIPFQMLYTTSTNSFDFAEGTPLYVPVMWVDDSPPVIGNFPDVADRGALLDYSYSQAEFGSIYTIITVDGRDISLDRDYLLGMKVPAPGLPDGGGTQYITVAAFLPPLAKGQHSIGI